MANKEIEKIPNNSPKTAAFIKRFRDRLIYESYQELSDNSQLSFEIIEKACSLNGTLLKNDRCQAEFESPDQAREEEKKLDQEILAEIEALRNLKAEEIALSALETKITEMTQEANEFGEKVKIMEEEIKTKNENATLLNDLSTARL